MVLSIGETDSDEYFIEIKFESKCLGWMKKKWNPKITSRFHFFRSELKILLEEIERFKKKRVWFQLNSFSFQIFESMRVQSNECNRKQRIDFGERY